MPPDAPLPPQQQPRRRAVCANCDRPASVCLCSVLPPEPLATAGLLCVLQHPFEAKRKLASVPLLRRCLRDSVLLRLRRACKSPQLLALLEAAAAAGSPIFFLFPGPCAASITDAWSEWGRRRQRSAAAAAAPLHTGSPAAADTAAPSAAQMAAAPAAATAEPPLSEALARLGLETAAAAPPAAPTGDAPPSAPTPLPPCWPSDGPAPAYLLVAIDGTWREASEIERASRDVFFPPSSAPSGVCAAAAVPWAQAVVQVQLPVAARGGNVAAGDSACGGTDDAAATAAEHDAAADDEVLGGAAASRHTPAAAAVASTAAAEAASTAAAAAAAASPEPTCKLRTEPFEGAMTTFEAVARALAVLEAGAAMGGAGGNSSSGGISSGVTSGSNTLGSSGNTSTCENGSSKSDSSSIGGGSLLLEALLAPLRRMTEIQATHDPAVAARQAGRGYVSKGARSAVLALAVGTAAASEGS